MEPFAHQDFTMFQPSLGLQALLAEPTQQQIPTEHVHAFQGANSLYSSSLFVANCLDAGDGVEWNVPECGIDMKTVMATPPRTDTPPPPAYVQYPTVADMATEYMRGSSLEESPISSPGYVKEEQNELVKPAGGGLRFRSTSPLAQFHLTAQSSTESMCSGDDDVPLPQGVKMPQRKGAMQLWQFLYALLTDPEYKFSELVEWTTNRKEREFRLLEPEAIAIWWGHHKNKGNMSYDKLSRSLRYYYDKGIIKKIPGERYVYRFCIDPERMYKHIGNSECRPKLKPMPNAAKMAMSKYQTEQDIEFATNSAFVAEAPESLTASQPAMDSISQNIPTLYPMFDSLAPCGGNYLHQDLSMRRCVSLDAGYCPRPYSPSPSLSVSYNDLQMMDNLYYGHSPLDSPVPSNDSSYCSSPPPTIVTSSTDFDYNMQCSESPNVYANSSFVTSDATMWNFSQEYTGM